MNCEQCKKVYGTEFKFCPECGKKLNATKTQVYMNFGKKGPTSISFVLPNGMTYNPKNGMTVPLGNGISYTTK